MRITPFLLITLHFSQMGFTEDLTFMIFPPFCVYVRGGGHCFFLPVSAKKHGLPYRQTPKYCSTPHSFRQQKSAVFQGIPDLFVSPDDPSLGKVIGRKLQGHPVAGQDPDIVHPEFSGNGRKDLVAVLQLYAEHRVGQLFKNSTSISITSVPSRSRSFASSSFSRKESVSPPFARLFFIMISLITTFRIHTS